MKGILTWCKGFGMATLVFYGLSMTFVANCAIKAKEKQQALKNEYYDQLEKLKREKEETTTE